MRICGFILLILLNACTLNRPGPAGSPEPEVEYYDPDFQYLPEKSSWILDKINYQEMAMAKIMEEVPTLELDLAEGKARGTGGCNRFNGPVRLEGNRIHFGHLVTTKINCQSQPLENRYFSIINFGLLRYQYTPETLIIKRDRRSVLEFKRVN